MLYIDKAIHDYMADTNIYASTCKHTIFSDM
jgi:hypothetical protein